MHHISNWSCCIACHRKASATGGPFQDIRVMNREDVPAAFEEARKNTKGPTLIEFIIDPEEMVYPMIKPGGTLEDMILDC